MVYLDYSATTPVNKSVIDTYSKVCTDYIGNPNSLHKLGCSAKNLIAASVKQIASILGVLPEEVIFTSGASEANNLAIKGICSKYKNRGRHIITTRLEHSSVSQAISYLEENGFSVDYVNLLDDGTVDLEDLDSKIRDDTILVSIVAVNSEIGIIQPLDKISKIIRKYPKVYFHSDVTQAIGKLRIDFSCLDLASFSAQKFFGMKGVGCLIKKKKIIIDPLIHGGKSTTIFRSGTPATPLIVSLAKALRLCYEDFDIKYNKVRELHDYLIDNLKKFDIYINSGDNCVPHIINISFKNIKSEVMLHALEEDDIYVSTQTACSSGGYSLPLLAVFSDKDRASNSLRISLSYLTTKEELDEFLKSFTNKFNKLSSLIKN